MASQRSTINQNYQNISDEYITIENILSKNAEIGLQLGNSTSKFTQIKIPQNPEETIPGIPGTLLDSTNSMINALSRLQAVFQKFSADLAMNELYQLKSILSERETNKEMIDNNLDNSESFDKHVIERAMNQHKLVNDVVAKLNEYVEKNPASQKKTLLSLKTNKLPSLWLSYTDKLGKFNAERQSFKLSSNDLEQKMSSNQLFINDNEETAYQETFNKIVKPISDRMGEIAPGIHNVIDEFEKSLSWLKFPSDFKHFAQTHNISFCDIPLPTFERFKFSSQFTQPDQSVIPRFQINYYPLHAAVALANFQAENRNEINLYKGRRVYLMEDPNQNWVLAMQPYYAQIGFIPSSYVRIVGKKLAYIKREIIRKAPNLTLSNLNLVTVIKVTEKPARSYLVEDEDGRQFEVLESDHMLCFL